MIIIIPKITLYIANILKSLFCKYLSKNLITIKPTTKLASTPKKNASVNSNSDSLKIVAARTIGADNINEYFAAASLFTPNALAVVIVIPERETPGINANACDTPIINVCFNVKCS